MTYPSYCFLIGNWWSHQRKMNIVFSSHHRSVVSWDDQLSILDYILNFWIRLLVILSNSTVREHKFKSVTVTLSGCKVVVFQPYGELVIFLFSKLPLLLLEPMNSSWRAPTQLCLLIRSPIGFSNSEQSPSSCHSCGTLNDSLPGQFHCC